MRLFVGLGNPGSRYARNRHNIGFMAVDEIARVHNAGPWRKRFQAEAADAVIGGEKVLLIKPQTYMNLSGAALAAYARRPFWSAASDLLVVVDDVALPVGRYRLRSRGSAGGHNGLKSIQHTLATQEYGRLRVGIEPADRREVGDLADFVLSPFAPVERQPILDLRPTFAGATEPWLREGTAAAMNRHHAN